MHWCSIQKYTDWLDEQQVSVQKNIQLNMQLYFWETELNDSELARIKSVVITKTWGVDPWFQEH